MAQLTFVKKVQPSPLPAVLCDGTLTTLSENPYRLNGEARLENGYYYGDWRREGEKSSSFAAPVLVDWDQWRAGHAVADGITAGDLVEAREPPKVPRIPPDPVRTGEW